MTITETVKDYEVSFPYDEKKVHAVKSISGAWYQGDKRIWHIPRHRQREIESLRKVFNAVDQKQKDTYLMPEMIGEIEPLPDLDIPLSLQKKPYPYQEKGIAYCRRNKKVIIGDKPGLGKTIQAIGTICSYGINENRYLNAGPGLVICPSSLKINWQTEWKEVAGHRAMILSDSIKRSWEQFYKVGMCDVFITNYESLKKFFVQSGWSKPKEGRFRMSDIPFRENINIFKWIIVDESHRCFPYETKVLTNHGMISIGEIVENNRKDLLIASMNHYTNLISFKKINNVWRNELGNRKLFCIKHNEGKLYSTENHKVYTTSGRYKKISEIKSGESLYMLRQNFLDCESWKNNSEMLFKELRLNNKKCKSSHTGDNGQTQTPSIGRKSLRILRQKVLNSFKGKDISKNTFLQSELLSKVENDIAGNNYKSQIGTKKRGMSNSSYQNDEQSGNEKDAFAKNEAKQPNEQSGNIGKNEKLKKRTNLSFKRRKRPINRTPKNSIWQVKNISNGISGIDKKCIESIQERSSLLQSRYSNTSDKISNRSGRTFSSNQKMAFPGQKKNRNIKCVRVESVEVYQPTSPGQFGYSSYRDKIVYDLEIADNHNYFADGVLVSNCKDSSTQQSKFVMGMARGKEIVLELTGTPVLNKTKDLISQLYVINKLKDIVSHLPQPLNDKGIQCDSSGYQRFINRYCNGGNESTNVKELNYRLNKYCFFSREKSEVLKDLPEKLRQVIRCDITNRAEYDIAKDKFADYLRNVKGMGGAEIKKTLKGEIMVKMGILKQLSARGKMEAAKEYIDEILDNGQKIVVFVHHHVIADALKEIYPEAVMVTGRQTSEEKNHSVHEFQKCKKCGVRLEDHKNKDHDHEPSNTNIIICSSSGGEGLTLTAASETLMIEFPWTWGKCEQYEDRTHRISQTNNVRIGYLLGHKTIDEYCYFDIILKKKNLSEEVTGNEDTTVEEMIDGLLNLFNQK